MRSLTRRAGKTIPGQLKETKGQQYYVSQV
jgi:hypothetical protein